MCDSQLWIMNVQKLTTKLCIQISIKHDKICNYLSRVIFSYVQEIYYIKRFHLIQFHKLSDLHNQQVLKQEQEHFYHKPKMFNNGFIEILEPSPRNNNPKTSASLLIILKLIFYVLIMNDIQHIFGNEVYVWRILNF